MKDRPKESAEEQAVKLRIVDGDGVRPPVDSELEEGDDRTEQEKADDFWAGRNLAMRRSARIAA